MENSIKNPVLYWIAYVLLAAGLTGVTTWVWYLPLLGFLLALFLRRKAKKTQEALALSHASWQVNTFWIMLVLGIVLLGMLFGLFGMIGADVELKAEIDGISAAMSSGQIGPYEGVSRLWAIDSLRIFILVLLGWGVVMVYWPLKRIIHGGLALCAGVAPLQLSKARQWIALGIAIVFESLVWILW